MPKLYSQSFKDRAVRMVFDRLQDDDAPSRYVVIWRIACFGTAVLGEWCRVSAP